MAEEAFDVRELVEALQPERDPDFFPLNDLPNDVLVSVFMAVEDPIWVRHTVPLVCQAWNELYLTKDASPLHEKLEVDLKKEVKSAWQEWLRLVARPVAGAAKQEPAAKQELAPYRPLVHASRVISWAERRAGSVRRLRLTGSYGGALKDFSSKDLGKLVAVVGPSLTEIDTGVQLCELVQRPFWESLRDFVVPAGRLRKLGVGECDPSESDVEPLGQLAGSLEDLRLWTGLGFRTRLSRFPESFCALTELRRLGLSGHLRITAISAKISSLKKLKVLELSGCGLTSLPKELGELSELTRLNLSDNINLGTAPTDRAFPAELGNLKSLRELLFGGCDLRTVPAFVGKLESLEVLELSFNREEIFASLDFLVEGCPRLREVRLHGWSWRPCLPPRWTRATWARVDAFKAKLRAKNPDAKVLY